MPRFVTLPTLGLVVAALASPSAPLGPAPLIPNLEGKVMTVAGPVEPTALGLTLMHEHIFIDFKAPPSMAPPPGRISVLADPGEGGGNGRAGGLRDYQESLEEVMQFKRMGGGTIVDVTNFGLTRDPDALSRIAMDTGLNVVMGAGWYQKALHPPDMSERTVEELTSILVHDVTVGAQGTTIRSGIIGEVGVNGNPLVENEIKSVRASARAARITGAPLLLHSFAPPDEMMQVLDIIEEEGVELSRVVMAHSGRDISATRRFFERGVFVEWDYMGQANRMGPERADQIAATIMSAVDAGFIDQVLVAHDVCTKAQLRRNGGGGYTYIATELVPALKRRGMTDSGVEQLLVHNPRRALTFVEPRNPDRIE